MKLVDLILKFPNNPMGAGRAMRELVEQDSSQFLQDALPVLRSDDGSPGHRYVLALLVSHNMLVGPLSQPETLSLEEAIDVVKRALRIDASFDVRIVTQAFKNLEDSRARLWLLEVLSAAVDLSRLLPVTAQLLRHIDPKVRSKAVLMFGTANRNPKWVEDILNEPDRRIRANAVESMWGVKSAISRDVFYAAAGDADNRVRGNALLGLCLNHDPDAMAMVLGMAKNDEELFRATAAWVMGESGDMQFLPAVAQLMRDPDPSTRKNAFKAFARLKAVENIPR